MIIEDGVAAMLPTPSPDAVSHGDRHPQEVFADGLVVNL